MEYEWDIFMVPGQENRGNPWENYFEIVGGTHI